MVTGIPRFPSVLGATMDKSPFSKVTSILEQSISSGRVNDLKNLPSARSD